MSLTDELAAVAASARRFAGEGERVTGVLAAEPAGGARAYLCAFAADDDDRRWLAVDDAGAPVTRRQRVREIASIVAMCELAEETAGGGQLEELRTQLAALRITEAPPGIEEAEAAALALERTLGAPPRVASTAWLDEVGVATLELERALGQAAASPFAEAMKAGIGLVEAFAGEVEERYKAELT